MNVYLKNDEAMTDSIHRPSSLILCFVLFWFFPRRAACTSQKKKKKRQTRNPEVSTIKLSWGEMISVTQPAFEAVQLSAIVSGFIFLSS